MDIQKVIRRLISITEHLERTAGNNEAIAKDIEALEEATGILIEKEQRPIFTDINEAAANIMRIAVEVTTSTKSHVFVDMSGHTQEIYVYYYKDGWQRGIDSNYKIDLGNINLIPDEYRNEEYILNILQGMYDDLAALI